MASGHSRSCLGFGTASRSNDESLKLQVAVLPVPIILKAETSPGPNHTGFLSAALKASPTTIPA
ncbi:hypothetical protein EYF80_044944 [Liparis tanakae]|uniref:Uncharacterized protein n=1 Tax=Liparis tanakae TaxID=230148 RepID=A0A4Z2FVG8_9TELE|nr:hypothetical protein EYF80_044944 [Liparis tanakae]